MLPQAQTFVETDHCADLCDLAHQWGKEDALEHVDMRGSAYFLIGDAAWHSYNDGYAVGLQLRKMLVSPSPPPPPCGTQRAAGIEEMGEIEFMEYVLDTLRAGREPIVRLTDEQLAEMALCAHFVIEDERPSEEFTHYPFLY
jgi:hypothetical protein